MLLIVKHYLVYTDSKLLQVNHFFGFLYTFKIVTVAMLKLRNYKDFSHVSVSLTVR